MHITRIACGAAALLAASIASAEETAPSADDSALSREREEWLADYAGLKASMQRGYANLDWIVGHRGLDLAALDRETVERLRAAQGRADAVSAINDFFTAFHDPHFRPARGRAPEVSLRNATGQAPGESTDEDAAADDEPRSQSCAELGYKAGAPKGTFDLAGLNDWAALESPYFTAGTSERMGVLRIPSFDERNYLSACEAAWRPYRTARETQLATRAALQHELTRLAGLLHSGGAEVLAIDVTGNGGGSEWSEEAAALFSAGELTRPSPRLVEARCGDRAAIWRNEPVCSNLAPQGELDRMAGLGAWRGPVAVLVDHRSASAAEDFAYWLVGSGVAKLVGERTFGAGCGYVDGGWAYQFTAFDAHAMMPNCSRYTAEGINQIEGLVPHVAFDWGQGVADLSAALDRMAGQVR